MYSYRIYGLDICSEVPLPQLTTQEAPADVVIRLGTLDPSSSVAIYEGRDFRVTPQGIYLFWQDVGTFLVKGGCEIIVDPALGVDENVFCSSIQETIFSVLLHQRGFLVYHAATVAVDGNAIAFIGDSGRGKSTLAMAFHRRGYGVIADDITAVTINVEERPLTVSGLPRLKLCQDTIISMGGDLARFPLFGIYGKYIWSAIFNAPQHALPLRCVYVLNEGSDSKIEPLRPHDAFVELLHHSVLIKLLQVLEPPAYFLQFAKIVNTVPISRLTIHKSFEALPEVIRMVEEDLRAYERT